MIQVGEQEPGYQEHQDSAHFTEITIESFAYFAFSDWISVSYKEARKSELWRKSMQDELDSLEKQKTWELVLNERHELEMDLESQKERKRRTPESEKETRYQRIQETGWCRLF